MVVREIAVGLTVELRHRASDAAQELRRVQTARSVAAVADDLRLSRAERYFRDEHVEILGVDVGARESALARSGGEFVRLDDFEDLLYLFAPYRRLVESELEAVEFLRIVTASHHYAAADGKAVEAPVERRRGDHAYVGHVYARCVEPLRRRSLYARGRKPSVAAQRSRRHAARR